MTVDEFTKENGLTISTTPVPENPHRSGGDEKWKADHWHCVIGKGKSKVTVYFSKGIGLRKKTRFFPDGTPIPPTLPELLESLQLDCAGVLGNHFEEWANDCGYDEDSRKAAQIYKTCCQLSRKLQKLFGGKAFADFLAIEFNG